MVSRFDLKARLPKGGEMMRTLGLMIAMVCLVAGATSAASTGTIDLFTGGNMICAPLVPFNPYPTAVLPGVLITGRLNRWEATVQSWVTWDPDASGDFGNVLLGDGYWYDSDTDQLGIQYSGVDDGVPGGSPSTMTDMWVSLPGNKEDPNLNVGGAHLIGQPFQHNTLLADIRFTDGTSMETWAVANSKGWVAPTMTMWLNAIGGYVTLTADPGSSEDCALRAQHGYWVTTLKDDIAMVILATPDTTCPDL